MDFMDRLPNDPYMLLSAINMMLRDNMYDSLQDICAAFDRDEDDIKARLASIGYVYDSRRKCFSAGAV